MFLSPYPIKTSRMNKFIGFQINLDVVRCLVLPALVFLPLGLLTAQNIQASNKSKAEQTVAPADQQTHEHMQSLEALEFTDQYDQVHKLSLETKWVIFAAEMDAFKFAKAAFEKLEIKSAGDKGGLLVSDISGMPSLVSALFAMPKMKKYSFSVALDRKGETTQKWPRKEAHLTLLKLNQLKVVETTYLGTEQAVVEFLKLQ